jgi:predicted unusual protein kinase regulating ubiquinone biosynthesis (AarF/ABC1/UbiB family)
MPASIVHAVLVAELGPRWRQKFLSFDDNPAAAASIGQVHRAVWKDGREVAVKMQYPGAGQALISDLNQVSRVARLAANWIPGLDIKPILEELKSRVAEELDYGLEAKSQKAFAAEFKGDLEFAIPDVVYHKGNVLVSEWLDGTPLSRIIATGTQQARDAAATRYLEFLRAATGRVAACRPTSRQLPDAARRPARDPRLWRGQPVA